MVKLSNAKKIYKGFELDCSMEVKKGQITGLVGRNGAGKSTAFKAMLGLIRIDGGSAEVFGKSADKLGAQDKEKIGAVLANSGFSNYLSIKEIVPVLDRLYVSFARDSFIKNCERFELPLNKKIKDFSTGMKRKLQILTALSHNASLLILDEPTAGLDVVARDELLGLLREYMESGERSVVISSHISSDLEGLCDDLYMIEQGKILIHEDTDVLLSDYGFLKVTQGQFDRLDKRYIIKSNKESYGYGCLTNKKQFYQENYPDIAIERGSIDELIINLIKV